MKYEIEDYLDNLQGFDTEINQLKDTYQIYKGIKHTFPSKTFFDLLDGIIFPKNENNRLGPFTVRFLLLLTYIKQENNKRLGVIETPFTY